MGLDLILKHRKRNWTAPESIDEYSRWSEENGWEELAYGRKTWGIYSYFKWICRPIDNCIYAVTASDWQFFIDYFKDWDIGRIRKILDNIDSIYNEDDDLYLTNFVEGMGDGQLGIDWDASTMLEWYDANETVQKAFTDRDEVVLIASY